MEHLPVRAFFCLFHFWMLLVAWLASKILTHSAKWDLPPFLLPYSVPLEQPHGVLALGVEAVLLLPPHPCPQRHTARQGHRAQVTEYNNTPLLPLHSVPQWAGALSQWGRVRLFQLCALWVQIFRVYWDEVRSSCSSSVQGIEVVLVLISGFALPKC